MDIWNSTGRGLILHTKCKRRGESSWTRFNPSLVELLLVHIVLPQFQSYLPFLWQFWQKNFEDFSNPHIPNKPFLVGNFGDFVFTSYSVFLGTVSTYLWFCESLPGISKYILKRKPPNLDRRFQVHYSKKKDICNKPQILLKSCCNHKGLMAEDFEHISSSQRYY